jgi:hypothetical protein
MHTMYVHHYGDVSAVATQKDSCGVWNLSVQQSPALPLTSLACFPAERSRACEYVVTQCSFMACVGLLF